MIFGKYLTSQIFLNPRNSIEGGFSLHEKKEIKDASVIEQKQQVFRNQIEQHVSGIEGKKQELSILKEQEQKLKHELEGVKGMMKNYPEKYDELLLRHNNIYENIESNKKQQLEIEEYLKEMLNILHHNQVQVEIGEQEKSEIQGRQEEAHEYGKEKINTKNGESPETLLHIFDSIQYDVSEQDLGLDFLKKKYPDVLKGNNPEIPPSVTAEMATYIAENSKAYKFKEQSKEVVFATKEEALAYQKKESEQKIDPKSQIATARTIRIQTFTIDGKDQYKVIVDSVLRDGVFAQPVEKDRHSDVERRKFLKAFNQSSKNQEVQTFVATEVARSVKEWEVKQGKEYYITPQLNTYVAKNLSGIDLRSMQGKQIDFVALSKGVSINVANSTSGLHPDLRELPIGAKINELGTSSLYPNRSTSMDITRTETAIHLDMILEGDKKFAHSISENKYNKKYMQLLQSLSINPVFDNILFSRYEDGLKYFEELFQKKYPTEPIGAYPEHFYEVILNELAIISGDETLRVNSLDSVQQKLKDFSDMQYVKRVEDNFRKIGVIDQVGSINITSLQKAKETRKFENVNKNEQL